MKAKSKIPKRTKILLILLVISLVILLATVIVGELWLRHIDRKFERETMSFQAKLHATAVFDFFDGAIKMNHFYHPDPACWKTRTKEKTCDPLTSPMFANIGEGVKMYALVDYMYSGMVFMPIADSNEFSDATILSQKSNLLAPDTVYLGDGEAGPILEEFAYGESPPHYYRLAEIKAFEADTDNDGQKEEMLEVKSTVKWPDGQKVAKYSTTRFFKQP